MRHLYSLILYLMLPWVLLRLWLKGFGVSGYRRHWAQRLGLGRADSPKNVVWIHAVSVGEVLAAQTLIQSLLNDENSRPILLTTTTPTGRDMARRLFGKTVNCSYLPYDLPGSVRRFLNTMRPAITVIMETEIWPNLYHHLHLRRIPLLLLNARLTERSLKRYLKLPGLARATIRCVARIGAQTEADAQRFIRLGARQQQLLITGNLKFSRQLPEDFDKRVSVLATSLGPERLIWVAGSTHRGEEQRVLEAHRRILQRHPDALLLIVPRHPERASELSVLIRKAGMGYAYFSRMSKRAEAAAVMVVDTLGDLMYLYGMARAAFVGGSLTDKGGHNPVEPLLAGVPVITGPSVGNFQAVYQQLSSTAAVRIVRSETELAERVCELFTDQSQRDCAAQAALQVIEENRSALQRCLELLHTELAALHTADVRHRG